MNNKLAIIIGLLLFAISGCNRLDVKDISIPTSEMSINNSNSNAIIETDSEISLNENDSQIDTPQPIQFQNQGKWFDVTNKGFSLYANWALNNDLYTITKDIDTCSLNYPTVSYVFPDQEYTYNAIYAPNVSDDMLDLLEQEFGKKIEQVYLSNDEGQLFMILQDEEVKESCEYNYRGWYYNLSTHQSKELFWSGDQDNYYCAIDDIIPSSVRWLHKDKYIYFECNDGGFGQLLVNIDSQTIKSVTLESNCYERPTPYFSGNGGKVLLLGVDDGFYSSDEYLAFLNKCNINSDIRDSNAKLEKDLSSEIYNELLQTQKVSFPDVGWYSVNSNGWGFSDEYFYYLELGNGEYDDTHNRSIVRINTNTGIIEEAISADLLKHYRINLSNIRISVSPDGKYLLIQISL